MHNMRPISVNARLRDPLFIFSPGNTLVKDHDQYLSTILNLAKTFLVRFQNVYYLLRAICLQFGFLDNHLSYYQRASIITGPRKTTKRTAPLVNRIVGRLTEIAKRIQANNG